MKAFKVTNGGCVARERTNEIWVRKTGFAGQTFTKKRAKPETSYRNCTSPGTAKQNCCTSLENLDKRITRAPPTDCECCCTVAVRILYDGETFAGHWCRNVASARSEKQNGTKMYRPNREAENWDERALFFPSKMFQVTTS